MRGFYLKPAIKIKKVKTIPGHVLPLFYNGSIIHIDEYSVFEIEVGYLKYEPLLQFEKALKEKILIEVGADK